MSLIANLAEPAGTESHEQQEELTVRPPNINTILPIGQDVLTGFTGMRPDHSDWCTIENKHSHLTYAFIAAGLELQ